MMDGVLLVDKPSGMTSHDVVKAIRSVVRGVKVGHAGTLDPNATGILMVLLGKATKISRFLMGLEKEYIFTLQLGIETDTLDRWGTEVRVQSADGVARNDILHAASKFKGRYQQIAPSVSALKHKGVPLYKLARRGESLPVKTRVVVIRDFEVLDICHPYVTIRVVCSSGTYVRSLARDMGRYLGCGASVCCLRRVRVGSFHVDQAITLDDLRGAVVAVDEVILTIEESLQHLPRICMGKRSVESMKARGQPLTDDLADSDLDFPGEYVALTDETGTIVGIAKRSGGVDSPLRTERVL